MNSAWRLLPGFTSSVADIRQTTAELTLLTALTNPLVIAAGHTPEEASVWPLRIHSAVRESHGDLSIAAEMCAKVSDILSTGAAKLAHRDDDAEMKTLADMYHLRATGYRRGPDENGRYLVDDLLLFDLRQDWLAVESE
jgi:hypothetical protein